MHLERPYGDAFGDLRSGIWGIPRCVAMPCSGEFGDAVDAVRTPVIAVEVEPHEIPTTTE